MTADPWRTVQSCADELDCTAQTIRQAINGGRLVAFKDGGLLRIRQSEWLAYLERQSTAATKRLRRAS